MGLWGVGNFGELRIQSRMWVMGGKILDVGRGLEGREMDYRG